MKKKTHSTGSKQTLWLRYLRGELSDNESYDLENSLMKDKGSISAIEAIAENDLSTEDLEEDLADIRQRWQNRTTTKNRTISPWVRRVAAILFLGFTIWATMQYYQDQQGAALYTDFFKTDTFLAVRGESEASLAFKNALKAYDAKNFESSFTQFQYLSEQAPHDEQNYLYAALSAMQLGKDFEARQLLNKIKNLNIGISNKAPAYWYLALIYLKNNNNSACKQELDWLLKNTPNGQWGNNAAKLNEVLALPLPSGNG